MFKNLINLIKDLTNYYEELIEIEKEKRFILIDMDLQKLKEFEIKEQPFLLKLKSLNNRRQNILKEFGLPGEILENALKKINYKDAAQKKLVFESYDKLKNVILKIRPIIEKNNKIAEEYNKILMPSESVINRKIIENSKVDIIL